MGCIKRERLKALLNVHSYFSFGQGVSSPRSLVERAAELGYTRVGLTDNLGVFGAVELHSAARKYGLKAITGTTLPLLYNGATYPLVLLASSRKGYETLNELTTLVKAQNDTLTLSMLENHHEDLHVLTGGRKGFLTQLLQDKKIKEAEKLLDILKGTFRNKLWVQLYFDYYPWDMRRIRALRDFAIDQRASVLAAPEIRYATSGLFTLYDTLICGRLGITLNTPHPERPINEYQAIPDALEFPIPFPEAIENANNLAEELCFDLLPDRLIPPPSRLPDGYTSESYLESICRERVLERYPGILFNEARDRLERELYTLRSLGFSDFFLVVKEVMDFCRSRGIVASGRGSAAGSVICYLLGITQADPLSNGLLFERFLHTGKRSMPDIDIDISSSRRDEVFAWVEDRFPHSAMVCNKVTYYLSSAIQDVGRALGLPANARNALTKALGRDFKGIRPHKAKEAQVAFDEVLGKAPVKDVLIGLLSKIEKGFVRQIAPHSGGWVLSRYPLAHYSPMERSTGGLRLIQFDKDDTETLGLMKLDLLGLRMLSVFERTREEILKTEGEWVNVEDAPDDVNIWKEIQTGDTMTLFQLESPGQVRMSVQLKPETRKDLKDQVALFRPGPIQSGTVHPYLNRRLNKEKTVYLHPALEPILERSYGVILFQEQVMQIAHHFAGLDWEAVDRFRKLVSSFEDEYEIRVERERFIDGAIRKHSASRKEAEEVFNACAAFRGYGFAESHAWAFGLHAYTSAWLRHHYPAEYLAGVMSEQPGMYSASTVRQHAREYGIGFGRLDINKSGFHYFVEKVYQVDKSIQAKFLRPPLCVVEGVSKEAAKEVILERLQHGPFSSLKDVVERTNLPRDALEGLARAGAFDKLIDRREALFQIALLVNARVPNQNQLFQPMQAPAFPDLTMMEKVTWDYKTKGFTEREIHPVDLVRQNLLELGALPMTRLKYAQGFVRTGGLIVARQKPPTANGFAFFLLEDGVERVQVVISPDLWEQQRTTLRDAQMLLTEGQLQKEQKAWTLKASNVWEVSSGLRGNGYEYS